MPKSPSKLEEAIAALRSGAVVAFPTETFYGLGVDPRNSSAVDQLLKLKSRSSGVGVPFIADSYNSAKQVCDLSNPAINSKFEKLARKFWPGPLTIIAPIQSGTDIDVRLLGGDQSIAVRFSSSETATKLAAGIGGVIPATSANPHAMPPSKEWSSVEEYFSKEVHLLKEEPLTALSPSTIVKIEADEVQLIREGLIPFHEVLRCVELD